MKFRKPNFDNIYYTTNAFVILSFIISVASVICGLLHFVLLFHLGYFY
jgi:hypothetical protein